MEKLKFIVEKNKDGYWASREEADGIIGAYGETLLDLKTDIVTAYNLYQDKIKITPDNVQLQFDITSFFELYSGVIAAAGIGKRAGMQKSLISEYVNGKRKPSKKQIDRLLTTINDLGRELSEVEIA
jgi:hypothetical protein